MLNVFSNLSVVTMVEQKFLLQVKSVSVLSAYCHNIFKIFFFLSSYFIFFFWINNVTIFVCSDTNPNEMKNIKI